MSLSKRIAAHLETTIRKLSVADFVRWNPAVWQLHLDTHTILEGVKVDRLLDIGAGTKAYQSLQTQIARHSLWLDRYPRTKAIDLCGDAVRLGIRTNSLDMVFCAQVLEHVPEPWGAVREFARVVKPGGYVFVSVPLTGYLHNLPHDYYRFTEFGLKHLCLRSGLKVIAAVNSGGLFCFLGYIRSTIICPSFSWRGVGRLSFVVNCWLSRVDRYLDRLTASSSWCPVHVLVLAQKL